MNERESTHLDKLTALIERARTDSGLQEKLRSGDEGQVKEVLKEAGIDEGDFEPLIKDIDLIIELNQAIPFWRFGVAADDYKQSM